MVSFWTVVSVFLGGKNLVWGIGKKEFFFKKLATTTCLALRSEGEGE